MKKLLISACLLALSTLALAAPSQGIQPIPIFAQTVTYGSTITPFAVTTKNFPIINPAEFNDLYVTYPNGSVLVGKAGLAPLGLALKDKKVSGVIPSESPADKPGIYIITASPDNGKIFKTPPIVVRLIIQPYDESH